MKLSKYEIRYAILKRHERIMFWIAHRIPRSLRNAVLADCGAYATTREYSNTVVPEVTFMEVYKRQGARV